MQSYVSAQVSALRSFNGSRYGFAWAPKNLNAVEPGGFTAQTDAILERLAAAIADADACAPFWCGGDFAGAAFNIGWQTFATWKPSLLAFTTPPQTIVAGTSSSTLTVEQRTNTGVAYSAGLPLSVTFATSSPGGSFSPSTDGPWTTTLTLPIASGASTVSVYYSDTQPGSSTVTASAAGRVEAIQAETIEPAPDTTPPETTITSAPTGTLGSASASISFSSEPGARFECALDGAPFADCTSPTSYGELAHGAHAFDVRALDAAGNLDPSPARATWAVDTVAPDTQFTQWSRPASRSASFWFTAGEDATFQCSLDGGAWLSCTSPKTYTALSRGWHTVRARAADAVGNVDSTPASQAFKI
jgi:hypothetical protein